MNKNKVMYLLKTAWKSNKKLFLIIIGHNLFEAVISMVDILGIGIIVNALITGKSERDVFRIIVLYILVNIGISFVKEFLLWSKDIEQRKSTNDVQYMYARQSLAVDFKYIQTGEFLNLKRSSMNIMPAFYITDFGKFVSYTARFIGILSIFTVINPLLVLCIILLSIPSVLMSFYQKKAEYSYKKDITEFGRKSDYLYKTMTEYNYAKDIRIYGGAQIICEKYIHNSKEQIQEQNKLGLKTVNIQNIGYLFHAIQLLCMLISFSYMVYRNEISIAEYTILLSSTILFTSIITGFFENIADIKAMCGYMKIIEEYDTLISNNSKVYHNTNPIKPCNLESISIDFEHVSFRYPNTEHVILDDVSFHISKGEKVSFVGLNGAGKTTVIKLLLRLYEPTSGRIMVNGIDIQNIDSKDYYEHIGIVLQDFFIFAYSVIENLCFDREAKIPEIETVIEQAGLKERIAELPKGLYTSMYKNLDAEGIELSEGEGQKLAMARALYKNTGLLILDEPTSSLDPLAEYELFSKMRQISDNNTAIMVSHRLSSTKYSDRIFVFEAGKLVQSGSHTELVNTGGVYRELFMTQAKYYTGEGELYAE